jgi:hypothetical protein
MYSRLLVDGFMDTFNCPISSVLTCVCPVGMTKVIDGRPGFGCDTQNSCCDGSGIMMRLKLVKTMEEQLTHA